MDQFPRKAMQSAQSANLGLNYANQANALAYPDSPPRRSALDEIGSRLAGAVNQATLLCDAAVTLEGRLMGGSGGVQIGDKSAQVRPMPSGHVGQINAALDELFARIETCAHTVSRLSDAI